MFPNLFTPNKSMILVPWGVVPTGSFVVVQFADNFRDVYVKKPPTKLQQKAIVDNFCRGRQYERLEGHLFLNFSADNGNEDMSIQEYFGCSHALHLLPAVFRNSFSLQINYFLK